VKYITFFLGCLISATGFCGSAPEWVTKAIATNYIPVSEKTDAVMLWSDTDISFKDGCVIKRKQRVYKITRLDGFSYGSLAIYTENGTKVSRVKGYRLSESGKLLETLERKRIVRRAYNDSFYDDAEQLFASFKTVDIGDIIAFEYKIRQEPFFKQAFVEMGYVIETAVQRIHVPENSSCAILNDPNQTVRHNGNTYEIVNQPMIELEDWGPTLWERAPLLLMNFGSASKQSWSDLSKMIWSKTRGLTELSQESLAELTEVTSIKDKSEFIRGAIQYVSQSMRYADIEVGAGRFVPTSCNIVHQKKYGDCKDMAYYAIAILKQGGVTAHPVLARVKSDGPVYTEFPTSQFNHVVIAVELDDGCMDLKNIDINGSPYLIADLTNKYIHLPEIPSSLENTYVLPMMKNGCDLVYLPFSPPEQNTKDYDIRLKFHGNRELTGTITEKLSGQYCAREKSLRAHKDGKEKDKMYRKWIQGLIPGAFLQKVTVDESIPGEFKTVIDFSAQNLGMDINNILYLGPNIMDNSRKGYKKRKRQSDLLLSRLYTRNIHVEIDINPVFTIKSIPESSHIDNEFFIFDFDARQTGQMVIFDLKIVTKTTRIPVEKYPVYRKEFKKYLKTAKSQIKMTL